MLTPREGMTVTSRPQVLLNRRCEATGTVQAERSQTRRCQERFRGNTRNELNRSLDVSEYGAVL